MKKMIILNILIQLIINFDCKAQETIVPMWNNTLPIKEPNLYYKDMDNDLNKFEGTWKFENNNTSFTIVLIKREHVQPFPDESFSDLLIGEYKYIENGMVIINTLNNINNSAFHHNIQGFNLIHKFVHPVCNSCDTNERRIKLLIVSPNNNDAIGWLTLRYVNENGIEKLEANISYAGIPPATLEVPLGDYILIKQ